MVATFADLPPETVGNVFEYCDDYSRIMAVCRAWRSVALCTPQLWTSITFSRPEHFTEPFLSHKAQQIARSGACPLDVFLSPNTTSNFVAVTNVLRPCVSRFRTFEIHASDFQANDIILSLAEGQPAPLLEHLSIITQHFEGVKDSLVPLDLERYFQPAPRLTHLVLPAYQLPSPIPQSPYLFAVTTLFLDSRPIGMAPDVLIILEFLPSLPQLHNLTYKSWDGYSWQRTAALDFPLTVTLPHLTTLDITVPGSGFDILRCLDAPHLVSARLDGWRPEEYDEAWAESTPREVMTSLRRLSQRSPVLKHIELRCFELELESEDYDWILCDAFSRLETLTLDTVNITDSVFTKGACASLRRLEVKACGRIPSEALIRFCHDRERNFQLLVEECGGSFSDEEKELLSDAVEFQSE